MTIVGNIILDDKDCLEKLNNLISKYDLKSSLMFLSMNLYKNQVYSPYLKATFCDINS
jgi:hypothetical protein